MAISGRLKLIYDMIPQCSILSDIGTDHAYIPAYALLNNRCEKALACDVKPGPLERAKRTRKKYNLEDRIFDIIIPMEETVEERNGKKKLMSRKLMPCYLLVKMKYADDLWHNVTRTRGITGFVGPKGRPLALTQDEIRKLHLEKIVVNIDLRANDKVEVIDGPLNSFIGTVISVDISGKKCKVNVEMFGRETPVDLDFSQIRKI